MWISYLASSLNYFHNNKVSALLSGKERTYRKSLKTALLLRRLLIRIIPLIMPYQLILKSKNSINSRKMALMRNSKVNPSSSKQHTNQLLMGILRQLKSFKTLETGLNLKTEVHLQQRALILAKLKENSRTNSCCYSKMLKITLTLMLLIALSINISIRLLVKAAYNSLQNSANQLVRSSCVMLNPSLWKRSRLNKCLPR